MVVINQEKVKENQTNLVLRVDITQIVIEMIMMAVEIGTKEGRGAKARGEAKEVIIAATLHQLGDIA